MVSESDVKALESIIVEHAGPMGKFVVKKSMIDLGVEQDAITGNMQTRFIDMVLERAIFDRDRWDNIRNEIYAAWGNGDSDV